MRDFASSVAAIVIAVMPLSSNASSRFVRVQTPQPDTLAIDESSIRKSDDVITFTYVLDVPAVAEGVSVPAGVKSNEVEMAIDCGRNTYSLLRIIAHTGPGATGNIATSYVVPAHERQIEAIPSKSTFAYLAAHVCGTQSK